MPYVGRGTDKLSNVEVLDNITFDGSSSYTLQKSGSNFTPSSANNILISIDGVVQAGNFTVSGSTIDFGTAVAGTSTCDFILHYGIGLITTPSDGTVTTAKLADSSVSLAKLTATGTKDATTFLRGDNTFASAGSPSIDDNGDATAITINSNEQVEFTDGTSSLPCITNSGDTDTGLFFPTDNNLSVATNGSERMRINSLGQVGIGQTSLGNSSLYVKGNIGSPLVTFYRQNSTSTADLFNINSDVGGTETRHFLLECDGDIFNTNNSYGSLSDRKFKENETDANSQWNDIKALQIKNYNLKMFPNTTHLGVIAQDLEASGINGLVKNKPDVLYTENDVLPEGKNIGDVKEEGYKEVKYSILYLKAVKALQEAMERIETLEAKVIALENA